MSTKCPARILDTSLCGKGSVAGDSENAAGGVANMGGVAEGGLANAYCGPCGAANSPDVAADCGRGPVMLVGRS